MPESMPATWNYSGANVTQKRLQEEEPSNTIQVHIRVEPFSSKELQEREMQEAGSRPGSPSGPIEDGPASEDTPPPPTLQELCCTFNLKLMGGDEQTSDIIAEPQTGDAAEDGAPPEEDEEAERRKQEAEARKLLFAGDEGIFFHTFTCAANFDESTSLSVCDGSLESCLMMLKDGQEAPLVVLPLDLSPFVAAERRIELWCSLENTELSRSPYNLKGFTVLLCTDRDVLSRDLRQSLNPFRITIAHADRMPHQDTSGRLNQTYQELRETCRPVFCRYSFLDAEVETHGVLHAERLDFKSSKVFCVGTRSVEDLHDYLLTTKLNVRIFDRELIPLQKDMQESADAEPEEGPEGEDGDEEGKRSPKPPTWSGLRSIDKARATELPPPCLHGIATVSLAPLVQRTSTDRLTEIATVRPERVEHTAVYQQRKFPSAFLECGTTLTVQADLSFPLPERHERGNFQRAVIILSYADTERLHRIEEIILRRNCEALDGKQTVPLSKDLDPLLLKKSMAAVELDEVQQRDANLDFISGLQLIDGEFRIFVLEGYPPRHDPSSLRRLSLDPAFA